MKNPIPHTGLWTTPESVDQLFEYCNRFSGSEKTVALNIAMMALNLAHKLTQQVLDKETV